MTNTKTRSIMAVILSSMLLFGCATQQPNDSSEQRLVLGNLSFLPPPGEGWEIRKDKENPAQFIMFIRRGDEKAPDLVALVWQVRADRAVMSDNELEDYLRSSYSDPAARKWLELVIGDCGHDESFAKGGGICPYEGKEHRGEKSWDTSVFGTKDSYIKGHAHAFVDPDDRTLIGMVEYAERGLAEQFSVDTGKLLDEFMQGMALVK